MEKQEILKNNVKEEIKQEIEEENHEIEKEKNQEIKEEKNKEVEKLAEDEEKPKEKRKSKLRHLAIIIIVILGVAGIGYLTYKKLTVSKKPDYKAVPAVNVTNVRYGNIEKEASLIGTILPADTYFVPAKVGGEITKIYVQNGDYVKKGDPICEIDASKEIEAAYIQYNTAKKAYERMQKLYNAGDISLQNFETVKSQYDAAKLAYDTKMEYSTPVAVGDGVVENTNMTINTSVKVEHVLCYITSNEAKEINFGVTERVLDGIHLNDIVKIEKNGNIYEGYVTNIGNLVNQNTGLFDIKAVITTPNKFASGIMAKVTFVYEKKNNVMVLPNEMIYYENGNAFVYTVGDDNVITKKYVEIGLENKESSEIVSGIDKNIKIVSTWTADLAEGTIVTVNKIEEVANGAEGK